MLFPLSMKYCTVTVTSLGSLLSLHSLGKENLRQEVKVAFCTLGTLLVFQSHQKRDHNLDTYFQPSQF